MQGKNDPKVKSLYKALQLLEYFDESHREAGVTELAEYSGMLKSSVHNILQTFEQCGYVIQNHENSKYMLGGAAVTLFSKYKQTRNLDYRITEYLQMLKYKFGTNVYFGEKDNDAVVYLCSEQSFSLHGDHLTKVGARVPLHCSSMGKVLLSYSQVQDKELFYRNCLDYYTDNTITDVNVLQNQVESILYQGYATTESEYTEGMYCVAVPIIIGNETVKYSIAIGANEPISDYMLKRYLHELRIVSKEIAGILANVLFNNNEKNKLI